MYGSVLVVPMNLKQWSFHLVGLSGQQDIHGRFSLAFSSAERIRSDRRRAETRGGIIITLFSPLPLAFPFPAAASAPKSERVVALTFAKSDNTPPMGKVHN